MGQDPVAGRVALMGKAPQAAGALRAVAQLARWAGLGPFGDRARGVAVVESFDSFIARIADVSAGDGDGPKIHKVWYAVAPSGDDPSVPRPASLSDTGHPRQVREARSREWAAHQSREQDQWGRCRSD
jgi:hypothetical protein